MHLPLGLGIRDELFVKVESKCESGALVYLGLTSNITFHGNTNLFADQQSEADASRVFGPARLKRCEPLEKASDLLLGHALSLVLYLDREFLALYRN